MDYIFRDNEAKLSIIINCTKKGDNSQCTAEIDCNGNKKREMYNTLSDVINEHNGEWLLNETLYTFVRKHIDDDIDLETLMSQVSKTLQEHEPLTSMELLNMIENAVYYPDTHYIDVSIEGRIFQIKEADYTHAAKLKTWMMSHFRRILVIDDKQWTHMVKHIRDIAVNGQTDPTAPPVLTTLLDLVENNNVFSDFCEDFVSNLQSGGSQMSFMLREDTLYVPSDVYDYLRRKFSLSYGSIRQYTEKYLRNKTSSEVETITVHGKKKSFRFWQFSFRRLWEIRNTLSQKEVIVVTKEQRDELLETTE